LTSATQEVIGSQNRAGVWASILYVAISGNLFIALSSIFWGGFSDYLHFDDARIGEIMSTEFFGATAATVAAIFYMHRDRTNLRIVTYAALAVYAVGSYVTPSLFDSPRILKAAFLVCGFSSGTSFAAAATGITSQKNSSRLVAIFYGTPYITGVIFQPLLHLIFDKWGFGASFYLIAAAVAASVVLFPFFPKYAGHEVDQGAGGVPAKTSLVLLLFLSIALLLQYVGNSGLWLFFQRIGTLSGHGEQTTANIVGLGTGMALIGTALAALLAKRLNPLHGILLGTGVIILSSITLHFSKSLAIYAGSMWVFNIMTTFVTPFYFILLVKIFDPAKAVIVGNICLMLGFSLGPLLMGYTVANNDFGVAINATIVLFALSILFILFYSVAVKRERP
jgi:MFS family permease